MPVSEEVPQRTPGASVHVAYSYTDPHGISRIGRTFVTDLSDIRTVEQLANLEQVLENETRKNIQIISWQPIIG